MKQDCLQNSRPMFGNHSCITNVCHNGGYGHLTNGCEIKRQRNRLQPVDQSSGGAPESRQPRPTAMRQLFGFADTVWLPFVLLGLGEVAASVTTETQPGHRLKDGTLIPPDRVGVEALFLGSTHMIEVWAPYARTLHVEVRRERISDDKGRNRMVEMRLQVTPRPRSLVNTRQRAVNAGPSFALAIRRVQRSQLASI